MSILLAARIDLPQRHHGIRTGLEDVAALPDGQPVKTNAQLVMAARKLIETVANG